MSAIRRRRRWFAWLAVFLLGCSTAPLSIEEERQLGAEVEKQARQQLHFVRDEVVVGYVANLGGEPAAGDGAAALRLRLLRRRGRRAERLRDAGRQRLREHGPDPEGAQRQRADRRDGPRDGSRLLPARGRELPAPAEHRDRAAARRRRRGRARRRHGGPGREPADRRERDGLPEHVHSRRRARRPTRSPWRPCRRRATTRTAW